MQWTPFSTTALWILVCYAVLATLLIGRIYRRRGRYAHYDNLIDQESLRELALPERIHAIGELSKFESSRSSWIERSVSAVGVLAFISMFVATGIQTITASREMVKADQLQQQIDRLEERRRHIDDLIKVMSSSVETKYRSQGAIDSLERKVITYRLDQLAASPYPSHDEILEQFNLSMIIGDLRRAVLLLEDNFSVLDATSPGDQISLAEYYLLTGAREQSREQLTDVSNNLSRLSTPWKFRYYCLRFVLDSTKDEVVDRTAALLRVSHADALQRLQVEEDQFRKAMKALDQQISRD